MRTSVFLHLQTQRSALRNPSVSADTSRNETIAGEKCDDSIAMGEDARSSASAGRASRAWSMNESVAEGDEHELATIRVRTMYGCVFAVPLPRRHFGRARRPPRAKTSLQKYRPYNIRLHSTLEYDGTVR